MPEKIEPVLTEREWSGADLVDSALSVEGGQIVNSANGQEEDAHIIIALANSVLPDDDPRKITREKLYRIYKAADFMNDRSTSPQRDADVSALLDFADTLESYLPPEE